MGIQVNAIDLSQGNFSGLVPAFGRSFDQRIGVVMSATYNNRYFFSSRYNFNQFLHFIINRIHRMAIRFNPFIISFGRRVDQEL